MSVHTGEKVIYRKVNCALPLTSKFLLLLLHTLLDGKEEGFNMTLS